MIPHWLSIAVSMEQLLFGALFVGAFGRIAFLNRQRRFLFYGGLFTAFMLGVIYFAAAVWFLPEGV